MPDKFTNSQIFRLAIDSRLSEVRTAIPGKVLSYDRTNQTVVVEPQVVDSENPLPNFQNVKVIFPRGGDGYLIFDIEEDDFGLVLFCDREIGKWRNEGFQIEPDDTDQLGVSSPVFLPGLYPSGFDLAQSAGRTILGGDDIRLTSDNADQRVYKGDDLKASCATFLTALTAWIDAVSLAITGLGGSVTGPTATFKSAISAMDSDLETDLSDKVRIK